MSTKDDLERDGRAEAYAMGTQAPSVAAAAYRAGWDASDTRAGDVEKAKATFLNIAAFILLVGGLMACVLGVIAVVRG